MTIFLTNDAGVTDTFTLGGADGPDSANRRYDVPGLSVTIEVRWPTATSLSLVNLGLWCR